MPTVYPFVVEALRHRLTGASTSLDIGCGAKQYRPSIPGRYIGLDLPTSEYLLDAPEIVGSADHIELPDGAVDLVFGVGVFHLVPDVLGAFRECRRVLKRGGVLLIFDYQRHELERLRKIDPDARHIWSFLDLSRLLCEAGFDKTAVRDITTRVVWGKADFRDRAKAALYRLGLRGTWLVAEAVA